MKDTRKEQTLQYRRYLQFQSTDSTFVTIECRIGVGEYIEVEIEYALMGVEDWWLDEFGFNTADDIRS